MLIVGVGFCMLLLSVLCIGSADYHNIMMVRRSVLYIGGYNIGLIEVFHLQLSKVLQKPVFAWTSSGGGSCPFGFI